MSDFEIINRFNEVTTENSGNFLGAGRLSSDGRRYRNLSINENPTLLSITVVVVCLLTLLTLIFYRKKKLSRSFSVSLPKVETDPKKKLLEDFTPQMVETLGGVDKFLDIPTFTGNSEQINQKDVTASLMKGYHSDGSPFLLFHYLKYSNDLHSYIRTTEYLERDIKDPNKWKTYSKYPGELHLRFFYPINDGSLGEKFMLNKIKRLVARQAVGVCVDPPLRTPYSYSLLIPEKAYLKGNELATYTQEGYGLYEEKHEEGKTGLFLWDPAATEEENLRLLKEKFPAMDVSEIIF